jgi:drug/metabolite transporter (DMT)-like permease
MLIDSGFSQALIHEQNVTRQDESSIFWFNIVLGLLIYGCFWLTAPLIADFYEEPQLTVLIRVAFTALLFQSLYIVAFTSVLWFWLLRRYPASGLSSFAFLSPVFGVLCGAIILGEAPTIRIFVALGLIAIGLIIVNRPARKQVPG